jgi:hypothetical protein
MFGRPTVDEQQDEETVSERRLASEPASSMPGERREVMA